MTPPFFLVMNSDFPSTSLNPSKNHWVNGRKPKNIFHQVKPLPTLRKTEQIGIIFTKGLKVEKEIIEKVYGKSKKIGANVDKRPTAQEIEDAVGECEQKVEAGLLFDPPTKEWQKSFNSFIKDGLTREEIEKKLLDWVSRQPNEKKKRRISKKASKLRSRLDKHSYFKGVQGRKEERKVFKKPRVRKRRLPSPPPYDSDNDTPPVKRQKLGHSKIIDLEDDAVLRFPLPLKANLEDALNGGTPPIISPVYDALSDFNSPSPIQVEVKSPSVDLEKTLESVLEWKEALDRAEKKEIFNEMYLEGLDAKTIQEIEQSILSDGD